MKTEASPDGEAFLRAEFGQKFLPEEETEREQIECGAELCRRRHTREVDKSNRDCRRPAGGEHRVPAYRRKAPARSWALIPCFSNRGKRQGWSCADRRGDSSRRTKDNHGDNL